MVQLVIKDATAVDGRRISVVCDSGIISEVVGEGEPVPEGDRIIDGKERLIMPGMCNTHTHASMALLRGIGEDRDLQSWLKEEIWPREAKMKEHHFEAGMALACLEMIKTGTTLFNDMYFMEGDLARVVDDMGLRAVLGEGFLDLHSEEKREENIRMTERAIRGIQELDSGRITHSIAPHSIYTVSREGLEWCRDRAAEDEVPLHLHLSETEHEVRESREKTGKDPAEYLDELGMLGPGTLLAHCVHLKSVEIDLISRRGCSVSHNPVSNMKLSSGGPMPLAEMIGNDLRISIGTDGAASNNTLDMFISTRIAALMSKHAWGADSVGSAEFYDMSTINGYRSLGLDGGSIREGRLADLILVDLRHHSMNPMNDHISNLVYSTTGEAVTHTIVDGEVLMDEGRVEGEKDIIQKAREAAEELR